MEKVPKPSLRRPRNPTPRRHARLGASFSPFQNTKPENTKPSPWYTVDNLPRGGLGKLGITQS